MEIANSKSSDKSFKNLNISTKLDLPDAQAPIKTLKLFNSIEMSLKLLKFCILIFDNLIIKFSKLYPLIMFILSYIIQKFIS